MPLCAPCAGPHALTQSRMACLRGPHHVLEVPLRLVWRHICHFVARHVPVLGNLRPHAWASVIARLILTHTPSSVPLLAPCPGDCPAARICRKTCLIAHIGAILCGCLLRSVVRCVVDLCKAQQGCLANSRPCNQDVQCSSTIRSDSRMRLIALPFRALGALHEKISCAGQLGHVAGHLGPGSCSLFKT